MLALIALASCTQPPTSKFVFADTSVTLPEEPATFPVRAGSDVMNANCAGCHSPSMILLQPALTSAQWTAEIKKMKEVYKAPVDPAAEPAILSYLEATSGANIVPAKGDMK